MSKMVAGRGGRKNLFNHSRASVTRITMRYATGKAGKSLSLGVVVSVNGDPHKVTKKTQGKKGKGSGFVRVMLKNLVSGQSYEKTWTSDEMVDLTPLTREVYQYSWNDGSTYVFLNSETFEEVQLAKEDVEDKEWMQEGCEVRLLSYKDRCIGVELPIFGVYTVKSISAGGNEEGKLATLDTGAKCYVPEFIQIGEKIRLDLREKKYVDRRVHDVKDHSGRTINV